VVHLKSKTCKPFIKWVGGKRQLTQAIVELLPKDYNEYFEPFVGGAAVLFAIKPGRATINDLNPDLINLYKVVKDKPFDLIQSLESHVVKEDYYYFLRNLDRDKPAFEKMTDLERASRFLFLNKTGYNGLYRVNRNGEFNVPFGRYNNPSLYDAENIKACSDALQYVTILKGEFDNIKNIVGKKDLVYLDPPYAPVSKTSNFTNYTEKGFDETNQLRLKMFVDYLTERGSYIVMSNSYTPFIIDLYSDYRITLVNAKRSINSNGSKRGAVKEVIITNYGAL